MLNSCGFIKLGKKNRSDFEGFSPDLKDRSISKDEFVFGILRDDSPCGVVELKKNEDVLSVSSIWIDYSSDDIKGLMTDVLCSLSENVKDWGFDSLSLRYTDDTPGITKAGLKKAGFSEITEEARVYKVSAYALGILLKEGPDSGMMRTESVRILDEERARVFALAPEKASGLFKELDPDKDLSFLTLDENGEAGCCSCISVLPDGSFYLSGLYSMDGNNDNLMGVLYLSLAAVFMKIEPFGELYFPAVNPYLNTVSEFLLSPLKGGVEKQRVFIAKMT